jgi:hypothetical protein
MITLFLLGLFVFAAAEEYPVTENAGLVTDITSPPPVKIESKSTFASAPARAGLENMTPAERQNSFINIELATGVPAEAYQLAGRIEDLWNIGDFTKALQLFPQLESLVGGSGIAIGNTWRVPVETERDPLWFYDIRIGNRSNIFNTELDIHRWTLNLFTIFAFAEGGNRHWSVNFSPDMGETWIETYHWWADYPFTDIGAIILDDYCYVGYVGNADLNESRVRRFDVADGAPATFPNDSSYVTVFNASDAINEIALTSNQEYGDDCLYYYALLDDNTVSYFYDDPDCMGFEEIDPGVTDARRGLSACTNKNFGTYYTLFSYLTVDDKVKVYGLDTDNSWSELVSYDVNSGSAYYTSIGAYEDNITCVFDYFNGTVMQCRYLVSYNGGPSWFYGYVGRAWEIGIDSPALTARLEQGVAMIYRSEFSSFLGHYTWRNYFGNWHYPVVYSEREPSIFQPDVEFLIYDEYGIVYISRRGKQAYFNKYKPTCMELDIDLPGISQLWPGRNFRVEGTITNTSDTTIYTDLWYGVKFEENFYRLGIAREIQIDSSQTLWAEIWHEVPENAPYGDYLYVAYAGKYSIRSADVQDSFYFQVAPHPGGRADAWNFSESTIEIYNFPLDPIPGQYSLIGNFPNPFNARTCIAFNLPEAGDVSLKIYNIAGQLVEVLVDRYMEGGSHIVEWDASLAGQAALSSGIYFCRLEVGHEVLTRRMTLLK